MVLPALDKPDPPAHYVIQSTDGYEWFHELDEPTEEAGRQVYESCRAGLENNDPNGYVALGAVALRLIRYFGDKEDVTDDGLEGEVLAKWTVPDENDGETD